MTLCNECETEEEMLCPRCFLKSRVIKEKEECMDRAKGGQYTTADILDKKVTPVFDKGSSFDPYKKIEDLEEAIKQYEESGKAMLKDLDNQAPYKYLFSDGDLALAIKKTIGYIENQAPLGPTKPNLEKHLASLLIIQKSRAERVICGIK